MSLTRISFLNFFGAIVPAIVAVPAMAVLARELSPERFGLVVLAWTLVGYSAIFDLGLARSVVRVVANHRGDQSAHKSFLSSAVLLVATVGSFGAVLSILLLLLLGVPSLGVPEGLQKDLLTGALVLAFTIPLMLVTAVLQAYWDGVEDFVEGNLQRVILGVSVPICTATAVLIDSSMFSAMTGVLVARCIGLLLGLHRRSLWRLIHLVDVKRSSIRELLSFGGWLAVSSTVSPVLAYFERFALTSVRGAMAAGYYGPVAEVAMRLLVLPVAVTRGLFPSLVGSRSDARKLVARAYLIIAATCIPVALLLVVFSYEILSLWLGVVYAEQGSVALRVLMLGFLFSSFAQIPYTQLLAKGRSATTAAIQIGQVVPYVILAFGLSERFGVAGAAIAWTVRNGIDGLILLVVNRMSRVKA